jgi:hypothetical protein
MRSRWPVAASKAGWISAIAPFNPKATAALTRPPAPREHDGGQRGGEIHDMRTQASHH